MVSHVFDAGMLISKDSDIASWDSDKRQIGIFESEVLACVPWLEGRTLSQTEGDVRSYQDVGNGYYLLRIQENYAIITLEEEK